MHSNFIRADEWSGLVIGAAIEVHRLKGPGLHEDIYERCIGREPELQKIPATNQIAIHVEYKGIVFDSPLRIDILVDNCLLVELKAVESVLPIHKAQLLSYMKLMDVPIGLLINFHELRLVEGVSRLILPGANKAIPCS